MTIAGLLFGDRIKAEIGYLELDVTIEEIHSWANEITSNPVEEGIESTDHIKSTPDILKLTGLATTAPLGEGLLSPIVFATGGNVQNAFDTLRLLKSERSIIKVVTPLNVYNSMGITNIDIPRRAEDGESIQYSVELREIRQVMSSFGIIPGIGANKAGSLGSKGVPLVKKGAAIKKPVNVSVLKGISG